jgi:hypothetical protein
VLLIVTGFSINEIYVVSLKKNHQQKLAKPFHLFLTFENNSIAK